MPVLVLLPESLVWRCVVLRAVRRVLTNLFVNHHVLVARVATLLEPQILNRRDVGIWIAPHLLEVLPLINRLLGVFQLLSKLLQLILKIARDLKLLVRHFAMAVKILWRARAQ